MSFSQCCLWRLKSAEIWQDNHSRICWRKSGGFCGQRLSAGGHSTASAVDPGCGQIRTRTRWQWLLQTGVCRWHCYPCQWKIPAHYLGAYPGGFEYGKTVVWWDSGVCHSIKVMIVPLTWKRDLRGLKEPNFLWTHCSWIPRSNTLDFFWTRDWHGRHSWQMWWKKRTGLFRPVKHIW